MPVATVTTATTDSNESAKKRKAPTSNGIAQKYYEGMFLPFRGTETDLNKWRQCKCNDTQKCQSISGKFKAIGDIRGTFAQVPSYSSLQPLTPGLLKKKDKLVRWMKHLRRTGKLMDFASINNRRQSTTTPTATRTRIQSSTVKQNLRYVAFHHFHPAAIAYSGNKKNYNANCDIPIEYVKDNIQSNGGDKNGFEDMDVITGTADYHFVPSYPIDRAKGDLKDVIHNKRLLSVIEDVTTSPTRRVAASTNNNKISNETPEQQQIRSLQKQVDKLKASVRLVMEQSSFTVTEKSNSVENRESTSRAMIGITRYTIQSDEYHKQNKNACNELFRFQSWDYTKAFIKEMFGVEYKPPSDGPLTPFEQCLLTLMYIESNHSHKFIGQVFGYKDHSAVSRIIDAWLPQFGEVGRSLSILPNITSDLIDDLEPQSYIDLGLKKVGGIIDGKDWFTDTIRSDRNISTVQQGNKLHHSSIRILTWSLPCGLNFEHTDGVFARATEKRLNDIWGKFGRLKNIPVGYIIMGDKGFYDTSGSYPNFNPIINPAFLHGNAQFSPEIIGYNLAACQLRYTCETVYSYVTNCPRMSGHIKREFFHRFQDVCDWAHGRANLYLPLQMPAKHVDYFKDCPRYIANEERKRRRMM